MNFELSNALRVLHLLGVHLCHLYCMNSSPYPATPVYRHRNNGVEIKCHVVVHGSADDEIKRSCTSDISWTFSLSSPIVICAFQQIQDVVYRVYLSTMISTHHRRCILQVRASTYLCCQRRIPSTLGSNQLIH